MVDTFQEHNNDRPHPLRVIAVTGGKGGIGKTTLSMNLSVAFAKMKKKVLLFDADLGLANIDVMLGLTPKKTLFDVLTGKATIPEICLRGPYGLTIIPSSSGIQKMAELNILESSAIIRSFSAMTENIDIMMIDMASGISNQVMNFTHASQDIVIVICNDPASLMDGYAVIKILHQKFVRNRFGVIVNKVKNQREGVDVFAKFQQAVQKFYNISMHYLGHVPQDDFIHIAAQERVSIVEKYSQSRAACAINQLCQAINRWRDDQVVFGGVHFLFEALVKNRNTENVCKE